MAKYDYNLVVIGAGSAGLVTSLVAAGAKAKVALVEKHLMGGDCLNFGCVPSKSLIRSASFMRDVNRCVDLGFKKVDVEYDFADVMERVASIIKKIEPHDSVERYTKEGVDCYHGDEAKILSPHEIEVGDKKITTRSIAICCGASPFVPPIKGIEECPHYTSDTIWGIREKPKKMIVLGGGPIGSELSQAMAYLGVDVTLIEGSTQLLRREDPEAAKYVSDSMLDAGVNVMLDTRAMECVKEDGKWKLVCQKGGGGIHEFPFDLLLCATGRVPNGKKVPGLQEAGVKLTDRGAVIVDDYLQTSVPNIYACGDIIGSYQFTHTAGHSAFYCAMNAMYSPLRLKVDWSVVPWCTFTHPEVARVGLNELEAKEKKIPYKVYTYGIDDNERAMAEQEAEGMVKVLTDPEGKGKILGVTIVGFHAGDLLHEYIVAMRNGLTLNSIVKAIHIYPTMAEANRFAAGLWRKNTISKKAISIADTVNRFRRGGD